MVLLLRFMDECKEHELVEVVQLLMPGSYGGGQQLEETEVVTKAMVAKIQQATDRLVGGVLALLVDLAVQSAVVCILRMHRRLYAPLRPVLLCLCTGLAEGGRKQQKGIAR